MLVEKTVGPGTEVMVTGLDIVATVTEDTEDTVGLGTDVMVTGLVIVATVTEDTEDTVGLGTEVMVTGLGIVAIVMEDTMYVDRVMLIVKVEVNNNGTSVICTDSKFAFPDIPYKFVALTSIEYNPLFSITSIVWFKLLLY